jgi:hypothetical protein
MLWRLSTDWGTTIVWKFGYAVEVLMDQIVSWQKMNVSTMHLGGSKLFFHFLSGVDFSRNNPSPNILHCI